MDFNKCVIEAVNGVGRDVANRIGGSREDVLGGIGDLGNQIGNLSYLIE